MSVLAQGAAEVAQTGGPAWLTAIVSGLATALVSILTIAIKSLVKALGSIPAAMRDSTREHGRKMDEVIKSLATLGHRFKSFEIAHQAEILTRPNIPPFIREQIEAKMRKREIGEDTYES